MREILQVSQRSESFIIKDLVVDAFFIFLGFLFLIYRRPGHEIYAIVGFCAWKNVTDLPLSSPIMIFSKGNCGYFSSLREGNLSRNRAID